tara:strand:+ start:4230 stop:4991 length:762 start_codon:yes stop_codon:yes gene_type:complete
MASAEITPQQVTISEVESTPTETVDLGIFFFDRPWCACGTPMSCCQCRATTSKEYQFSGLNMEQARILHSLYNLLNYERETLQEIDKKCDISKDSGDYVFDIDNPIGRIQFKYKNQGNNISICEHICKQVKEYIFPDNPTQEMINLVDRYIRDEIDYDTLIEEFKSTLNCRKYSRFELDMHNSLDQMYKYDHVEEFRIIYSEDMGWQIHTGNGDGTGTMIRIENNDITKTPCNFWLNPNGEIHEMTIDGKKII